MPDYSLIPSIEQLRQRPAMRALEARFGTEVTLESLRAAAASVRSALTAGDGGLTDQGAVIARIETDTALRLDKAFHSTLQPVINATGVIVHTNLGRAPLAAAALDRVASVARGYASLEYDVHRGERGRRDVHAEPLLCRLTGAEAAIVVNNNAAATMLLLAGLAAGREVVVSRGELVEIGGGFRVPDIMAQSGAILREVGTTNKTRASDYAAAISERTALILRVHPSNFRIEGFTERPTLPELVAVGRRVGVPVAEDLGSGQLTFSTVHPLAHVEPSVAQTIADGAAVCCFSGDKLLGGPQAGIIAGRADLVDRLRKHPLMRALRVDKMIYAALEATLVEYASGREVDTVPVQRMLCLSKDAIRERAAALTSSISKLPGWNARLLEGSSAVGGGSAPGVQLPTWLVAVEKMGLGSDALEGQLRGSAPPVIARIERDQVVLDLRTVLLEQDTQLLQVLEAL
ncbi:MAG TPA: L-seryl-tRNA(Sec) selenium transferase [Vicinamibacterales bacterium]|nr:L-seryl-tRNA(Sec) selenium transferase [Vicinamibacterales bacterium]